MYRIAVCDNDIVELGKAERCINKYLLVHPNIRGKVTAFQSARELQEQIEKRSIYDIYLLDILMPDIDGISLGRLIRKHSSTVPIVYITSTNDRAYEAYGVNALQYISKPLNEGRLFQVLDAAYSLFRIRPRHMLTLKTTDGIVSIAQEDIMYIENKLRVATYTLFDGSTAVCSRGYGSFESAVAPIPESPYFIQPHKSFFASLKYIRVFSENLITMDDGRLIPVNQHRLPAVRKAYLDYLSAGLEEGLGNGS